MGAFIAGAALANIPYRLEIEDKVEPIKNLGIILFFVGLGLTLNFSWSQYKASLPEILILSAIVFFMTPLFLIALGWIQKLKSRPSFYIGVMLNQISEFSLILALLAYQAGVFSDQIFLIIAVSAILTIGFSSLLNSKIDSIYLKASSKLKFIDRHAIRLEDKIEMEELPVKDHIILMEYNELNDFIADRLTEKKIKTVIVDLDPDKIKYVEEKESEYHRAVYADPLDPDIWEELHFIDAKLIISGLEENQESELALLNYLNEKASNAKLIVHTGSYEDADEVYKRGAGFVLMSEYQTAEYLAELIMEEQTGVDRFGKEREKEFGKLRDYKEHFYILIMPRKKSV